jgi:uncharacterized protein (TIGR01619 family)
MHLNQRFNLIFCKDNGSMKNWLGGGWISGKKLMIGFGECVMFMGEYKNQCQAMTKKITFLFAFLIQALVSFSQEDTWDVYLAQYEKGVGSTLLNMSLKKNAPVPQYPFLLKTGVSLIDCSNDGLPTEGEFNMLTRISDRVKTVIDSILKNIPAGTFSYQCERIDYYYINDTTEIRKYLASTYKKEFPDYKYSIIFRYDKNWEAYLMFLYPNAETYEYMRNDKVIMNLTKAGDNLSKPRQVDHWLYFKDEVARNRFITYALKEKYNVESKEYSKGARLKYQLQISRIDLVDITSISKITIELRKIAKDFDGEYDGWETFVVVEK